MNRFASSLGLATIALTALVWSTVPAWSASPAAARRSWTQVERVCSTANWERCVEQATRVRRSFQDSAELPQLLEWLGDGNYELGNLREASIAYRELLGLGPDAQRATTAWLRIGEAAESLELWPDATEAYSRAIATGVLEGDARHAAERGRLRCLLGQGEGRSALSDMEHLLGDAPSTEDVALLHRVLDTFQAVQLQVLAANEAGNFLGCAAQYGELLQAGLVEDSEAEDVRIDGFDILCGLTGLRGLVAALRDTEIRQDNSDPRRIGVLLPLSGRQESTGQQILAAIELAIGRLEATGAPTPELVIRDSQGDPELTDTFVRELVEQENVIAILGPLLKAAAGAAAETARELGVPLVLLSRREGLTENNPWVFRSLATNTEQARAVVDYSIDQLGISSFALFYPARQDGGGFAENYWQAIEERGGQVAWVDAYSEDTTTLALKFGGSWWNENREVAEDTGPLPFLDRQRPQVTDGHVQLPVPEQGIAYQAIIVADSWRGIAQLAPSLLGARVSLGGWFEGKAPITLLSGWSANHPNLSKHGRDFVRGIRVVDGFFSGSPDADTQALTTLFSERFDSTPSLPQACAYDSIRLLSQVLLGHTSGRRGLVERLHNTELAGAISGLTGYGPEGEPTIQWRAIGTDRRSFEFYQVHPEPPPLPEAEEPAE